MTPQEKLKRKREEQQKKIKERRKELGFFSRRKEKVVEQKAEDISITEIDDTIQNKVKTNVLSDLESENIESVKSKYKELVKNAKDGLLDEESKLNKRLESTHKNLSSMFSGEEYKEKLKQFTSIIEDEIQQLKINLEEEILNLKRLELKEIEKIKSGDTTLVDRSNDYFEEQTYSRPRNYFTIGRVIKTSVILVSIFSFTKYLLNSIISVVVSQDVNSTVTTFESISGSMFPPVMMIAFFLPLVFLVYFFFDR